MNIHRKKSSLVLELMLKRGKITQDQINGYYKEYLKLEKNPKFLLWRKQIFQYREDSIAQYVLDCHKRVPKKYLRELKYFNKFWKEVFSPRGQRRIERLRRKDELISKKVKKEKIKTKLNENRIIYEYETPFIRKLDKKLEGNFKVNGKIIFLIPNSKLPYELIKLKEQYKKEYCRFLYKEQFRDYKIWNNQRNFDSIARQINILKYPQYHKEKYKKTHEFELPREFYDMIGEDQFNFYS